MRHVRFAMTLVALLTLPGWVPAQAADDKPGKPAARVAETRDFQPATGSRIPPQRDARGECPKVAGAGKVFEKEDLERTGAIDVGDAIRQLDPSIR